MLERFISSFNSLKESSNSLRERLNTTHFDASAVLKQARKDINGFDFHWLSSQWANPSPSRHASD